MKIPNEKEIEDFFSSYATSIIIIERYNDRFRIAYKNDFGGYSIREITHEEWKNGCPNLRTTSFMNITTDMLNKLTKL